MVAMLAKQYCCSQQLSTSVTCSGRLGARSAHTFIVQPRALFAVEERVACVAQPHMRTSLLEAHVRLSLRYAFICLVKPKTSNMQVVSRLLQLLSGDASVMHMRHGNQTASCKSSVKMTMALVPMHLVMLTAASATGESGLRTLAKKRWCGA